MLCQASLCLRITGVDWHSLQETHRNSSRMCLSAALAERAASELNYGTMTANRSGHFLFGKNCTCLAGQTHTVLVHEPLCTCDDWKAYDAVQRNC